MLSEIAAIKHEFLNFGAIFDISNKGCNLYDVNFDINRFKKVIGIGWERKALGLYAQDFLFGINRSRITFLWFEKPD